MSQTKNNTWTSQNPRTIKKTRNAKPHVTHTPRCMRIEKYRETGGQHHGLLTVFAKAEVVTLSTQAHCIKNLKNFQAE